MGWFHFVANADPGGRPPALLFTDNHTNYQRLYQVPNESRYVKDAFHEYIIRGQSDAVNPAASGTKAAAHYVLNIAASDSATVELRLFAEDEAPAEPFGADFGRVFAERCGEADEFYRRRISPAASDDDRRISRQAHAGLLWTKQFYHYVVKEWLDGDPDQPPPPARRRQGRNHDWGHLFNRDVISMPDKWEYPWYAAWDSAFHMIPMAEIDPQFAKEQLILFSREWYMHPSGQLPAYEFAFDDVNPPVHAWACWRVYKMTGRRGRAIGSSSPASSRNC